MCGIAGCVGHEQAPSFVAESLKALEYRGYDSAGIAYPGENSLEILKCIGPPSGLDQHIPENDKEISTAIGHNRWATHGGVSILNTHPHANEAGTIAVVHNGTIENHSELRKELIELGYNFTSETDTEVIPHLIDSLYRKQGEPEAAITEAVNKLVGAYAVLALFKDFPEAIYAASKGSPLVLGVNGGEHFAGSNQRAFNGITKKLVPLEDEEVAELSTGGYKIWHSKKGTDIRRKPTESDYKAESTSLEEFPHYMLKEIYDAPETVRAAIAGRVQPKEGLVKLGGLEDVKEQLKESQKIVIVACGTSYHAGLIGERLIEDIAEMPVDVQLASEFKYRNEPLERDTAVIAISQSGETADTIAAINKAREYGLLALGVNNSPGSTLDRITEAGVHCRAGQEISVASTKAFISQVAVLSEIALALSKRGNTLHRPLMNELAVLPDKIEKILQDTTEVQNIAKKYAHSKNFLYIGRGYEHANAREGALKLKEISYIHAEGIEAGEMKHGTLALIDEEFPTMAIATDSPTYDKLISNIEEIKARKGPLIALASEGNYGISELADDVLYVPKSLEQTQSVLNAIIMQLFAYYVAVEKGLDVDKPRNLAKSVTVE